MEQEIVGPWPIGTSLKRNTFNLSLTREQKWDKYKRRYAVDENTIFVLDHYLKGGENIMILTPRGELIQGNVSCFYPTNPQSSLEDWM